MTLLKRLPNDTETISKIVTQFFFISVLLNSSAFFEELTFYT